MGWLWGLDEIERGFVVLDSAGPRLLPATLARSSSRNPVSWGATCASPSECVAAFHWSTEDPVPTLHPDFQAAWMNNPGTMFGHHEPAGGLRQLATVDRDGPVTPVPFDTVPGVSATPLYIADDGSLFINTRQGPDVPGGDAIVISNGATEPIGRGIAPRPRVCTRVDCVESARPSPPSAPPVIRIGVNTLHYLDANLGWQVASTAGFHWTAKDGAIVIKVGASDAIPRAVNSQGAVVGALAGEQVGFVPNEPFIWHRAAGGVLLRQLLHIGPHLPVVVARGIGDAGHLLLYAAAPSEPFDALVLYAPDPDICLP